MVTPFSTADNATIIECLFSKSHGVYPSNKPNVKTQSDVRTLSVPFLYCCMLCPAVHHSTRTRKVFSYSLSQPAFYLSINHKIKITDKPKYSNASQLKMKIPFPIHLQQYCRSNHCLRTCWAHTQKKRLKTRSRFVCSNKALTTACLPRWIMAHPFHRIFFPFSLWKKQWSASNGLILTWRCICYFEMITVLLLT